ncbi:co-chaperone YbbN [Pseudomonas brassicacearum]|uniref:Thiol reductase thioredoxin n=1 Tax=Pseudomonas brassicacearum TaxID=930166 RepID=A0A423GNA8_9PSED|nr:thioredoxin family protein [Pseudomonas brassicacearum]ROM93832.1 thiol reductase thioredoxin [Pseudomonas brassicacearum]
MSSTPHSLAPQYLRALRNYRPVVLYFGHPHCCACEFAGPIFRETAEAYKDRADCYMLNTAECPRHPEVRGTPTLLFYRNGKLLKKLKGFEDAQALNAVFASLIGKARHKSVVRKPHHDLSWLRHTLGTLRTVPRAHRLVDRRAAVISKAR